jgi:hypothetical protein
MRRCIALEAARIMAEEGVDDFLTAKRKAAVRLGAADTRNLPRNIEVQQALADHQRLFYGRRQARKLRELREEALKAMTFFERFSPRLVGSVLIGTAGEHSDVNLHLFADTPEEVVLFLMDRGIPYATGEHRVRLSSGEASTVKAVFRLLAHNVPIELTVFGMDGIRQAPKSKVDGKPMRRASIEAVRALLTDSNTPYLSRIDVNL